MPSKKQKSQSSPSSNKVKTTDSSKSGGLLAKRKPTNFLILMLVLIPLLILTVFVWSPTSLSTSVSAAAVLKQEDANDTAAAESTKVRGGKLLQKRATLLTEPRRVAVEILAEYSHDRSAFTQGLEISGNSLYESTGLHGHSTLRHVDLLTGNVLKKFNFPNDIFAEGVTVFQDKIYVLTWVSHKGFVFDMEFNLLTTWSYNTQGWGLTHNSKHLIQSDGSNRLYFISPKTLTTVRTLEVFTVRGQTKTPLGNLNELEWINGYIYANVWYSRDIAVIHPRTGMVVQWLDCSSLPEPNSGDDVLNGIAYNNATGDFYLTGKNWPKLFKVKYENVTP